MDKPRDGSAAGRTVVVGGGLAGLTTAALLARAGHPVVLLEAGRNLGGRARTSEEDGYRFNLGAHALYPSDPGTAVLRDLRIDLRGGSPPTRNAVVVRGGELHRLPQGPVSLVTSGALPWRAKIEAGAFLARVGRWQTGAIEDVPLEAWLHDRFDQPAARALVASVLRLTTYANAPDLQSAGAALRAMERALADPVVYLDGGWQTVVDQVARRARSAGAKIQTRAPVDAVVQEGGAWRVELRDGPALEAEHVVLATDPASASALVEDGSHPVISAWVDELVPVRACCLDLAVDGLPVPERNLALGVDTPHTVSVHSRAADLAPRGGELVHALRYLPPGGGDPESDRAALEGFLDTVQPGWREHVVHERFLPSPPVTYALPLASSGGCAGRPGPAVPGSPGLHVAGDWVGPEGMLSGASLASARRVATRIAAGGGSL